MIKAKRKLRSLQNRNCSELGLSAQGIRLERSTPVTTAVLKKVSEQCLDLCEFKPSTRNLFELTGPPQMNQNSEVFHISTTFRKYLKFGLDSGLGDE
jgi:hypothetical protein